jgi:hypothetical protein
MIMPFKKDDRGNAVSSLFWFVFYTNVAPAAVHMAAFIYKKSAQRLRRPEEPKSRGSVPLVMAHDLPKSRFFPEPASSALPPDLRCPAPECFNRSIETGVLHSKWG